MTIATLLVDGTDLRSLTGVRVLRMDLFAPGTLRGGPDTIGGRRGQVGAALPWDAYGFSVTVLVDGADQATMVANVQAVGVALGGTGGLVSLERRLPASGPDPYTAMFAHGQFAGGLSFTQNVYSGGLSRTTDLMFVNLDGAWTDSEDVDDPSAVWSVP